MRSARSAGQASEDPLWAQLSGAHSPSEAYGPLMELRRRGSVPRTAAARSAFLELLRNKPVWSDDGQTARGTWWLAAAWMQRLLLNLQGDGDLGPVHEVASTCLSLAASPPGRTQDDDTTLALIIQCMGLCAAMLGKGPQQGELCSSMADAMVRRPGVCREIPTLRAVAAIIKTHPMPESASWLLAILLQGLVTSTGVELLSLIVEPVAEFIKSSSMPEPAGQILHVMRASNGPYSACMAPLVLAGVALGTRDPKERDEAVTTLRELAHYALEQRRFEQQGDSVGACAVASLRLHDAGFPLAPELLLCMVDAALGRALADGVVSDIATGPSWVASFVRALMARCPAAFELVPSLAGDILGRVVLAAKEGLERALQTAEGILAPQARGSWDPLFTTCTLLLSAVAGSVPGNSSSRTLVTTASRQRRAALTLAALADLQFCVMDLSQYPIVVRRALSTLSEPDGRCARELFLQEVLGPGPVERLRRCPMNSSLPLPLQARWTFVLTLVPVLLSSTTRGSHSVANENAAFEHQAVIAAPAILECLRHDQLASRALATTAPVLASLPKDELEAWGWALLHSACCRWEESLNAQALPPSLEDKRALMEAILTFLDRLAPMATAGPLFLDSLANKCRGLANISRVEASIQLFEILMGSLLGCPFPAFQLSAQKAVATVLTKLAAPAAAPLLAVLRDFALNCDDATRHVALLRLYQSFVSEIEAQPPVAV